MIWVMAGCVIAAICAIVVLCVCVAGSHTEKEEKKRRNKK